MFLWYCCQWGAPFHANAEGLCGQQAPWCQEGLSKQNQQPWNGPRTPFRFCRLHRQNVQKCCAVLYQLEYGHSVTTGLCMGRYLPSCLILVVSQVGVYASRPSSQRACIPKSLTRNCHWNSKRAWNLGSPGGARTVTLLPWGVNSTILAASHATMWSSKICCTCPTVATDLSRVGNVCLLRLGRRQLVGVLC